MHRAQLDQVRRFHRLVTRRVGALEETYLGRGRPLAEARLLFELAPDGAGVQEVRRRLGLDSGHCSRLLRSLEAQGLVAVGRGAGDGRRRRAVLTARGRAEYAAYEGLSDTLAASILDPLDEAQRARLTGAMAEIERLLRAGAVTLAVEPPDTPEARACIAAYFAELAERFDQGFDPARSNPAAEQEMRPPAGCLVLARLDGTPVGCGALKRGGRDTGEIKRMWTAPEARGLGIARRVLRMLEAEARARGIRRLRLETNRALTEAQALYRAEGYREVPRFNDEPYAHHWFEKRLRQGAEGPG